MSNLIYFDNAATSPLSASALSAMVDTLQNIPGNPSSIHTAGREAARILREARQKIARSLATDPKNIFFTSGGTESNNTAIKGYALSHQHLGKHIISTSIEHHSILDTLEHLQNQFDFEITLIKPQNGIITAQQIQEALRPDTILVSTMFANNETGYILPIKKIGELLSQHQAVYHVDAVQVMGKIPVHPEILGIDLLSASSHKFHGPKGVGFLFAKNVKLERLLHGGNQEEKRRAGTENLPGIVGMATALQENTDNWKQHYAHVEQIAQVIVDHLQPGTFYLNQQEPHLPHILNLGFPSHSNDSLLLRLDLAGVAVSTGSACTAGAVEPSHVLASFYGEDSARLKESIRISLSDLNTRDEAIIFTNKLNQIIGG